ncbi:MAG: ABC transporter substrate-binding protein [Oscillospiraceae bacterium]
MRAGKIGLTLFFTALVGGLIALSVALTDSGNQDVVVPVSSSSPEYTLSVPEKRTSGKQNDLLSSQFYAILNRYNNNQQDVMLEVMYPSEEHWYSPVDVTPKIEEELDFNWRTFLLPEERDGQFVELNSYLTEDEAWSESFREGVFAPFIYGEHCYQIPVASNYCCVFYNTELFERTGIDPAAIQTWEDLLAACETLKQAGILPVSLACQSPDGVSPLYSYLVLRLGGADAVTALAERREEATFEQDCFIRAGEMLREMAEMGYFPEDTNHLPEITARQKMADGDAAIYFGSTELVSFFHKNAAKGKIGVLPFPTVQGGAGDGGQWLGQVETLAVRSGCAHREQAVNVLKYMTSEAVQRELIESGAGLPSVQVDYGEKKVHSELQTVERLTNQSGSSVCLQFERQFGEKLERYWRLTLSTMATGLKPPQQAFHELQADYEAME